MRNQAESNRFHVVIPGAGGNIGSHLVQFVARLRGVRRITLIDPDRYEEHNAVSQNMDTSEVGVPKVEALKRRIARVNPDIEVIAIQDYVERVPVLALRSNVILTALDSRRARQYVNSVAARLGIPWIDAGVQSTALLARVSVFVPGPGEPCMECGWSNEDYAALEQKYPCSGIQSPYSTASPAALGALAASVQALECEKLLRGRWDALARSQQIVISAAGYRAYTTKLEYNTQCRFDHRPWALEILHGPAGSLSLDDAVRFAADRCGTDGSDVDLAMDGTGFTTRLACLKGCTTQTVPMRLCHRIPDSERRCAVCGESMEPPGLFVQERLPLVPMPPAQRSATTLASLGFRDGDVFQLYAGSVAKHVCLIEQRSDPQ
jgi:molybdopterin/thiamine biosynthesis adenylyltransferase